MASPRSTSGHKRHLDSGGEEDEEVQDDEEEAEVNAVLNIVFSEERKISPASPKPMRSVDGSQRV
jgi:hypothetical protein